MNATNFLKQVIADESLQNEIRLAGISFEAVEMVAIRHNYYFTEAELNEALANDTVLLSEIEALLATVETDFELSEAELALVAGGTPMCCNCENGGPTYNPFDIKYA